MYKNAWAYIGFGFFTLLTTVNLAQYAEPAWGVLLLFAVAGMAFMAEGMRRRRAWLRSERALTQRFSF